MSLTAIVNVTNEECDLTIDDVFDLLDCECGDSVYTFCNECRDRKWKSGLCYGCLNECNPASQMCGRCARNGW